MAEQFYKGGLRFDYLDQIAAVCCTTIVKYMINTIVNMSENSVNLNVIVENLANILKEPFHGLKK